LSARRQHDRPGVRRRRRGDHRPGPRSARAPPSAERSYWYATGVEDGYDYLLTDDEITVRAYVPHSVCDDCDREALPGNDLCAVHADEVAGTDYAYEAWLSEKLGCL